MNAPDSAAAGMPAKLQAILDDFAWAEGREKLELLLDYAAQLPPLPPELAAAAFEPVHECQSPVGLHVALEDGRVRLHFDVPAEAPTVRGYAAILQAGLDGATPAAVLAVPPDVVTRLGLTALLTPQRAFGLAALLGHVQAQVRARQSDAA
jgi:cysteine desulfuration protein SufE